MAVLLQSYLTVMQFNFDILISISAVIAAICSVMNFTSKGRNWIIKPALDAIAEIKQAAKKYKDDQETMMKSLKRSCLRTELLLLMNDPKSPEKDVYVAYEKYKRMGGNFYLDDLFTDWKTKNNKGREE